MQDPEGWGRPLILLYIYKFGSAQPQLTTYETRMQPEFRILSTALVFFTRKSNWRPQQQQQ
jgi:hypothetical protein